ncbi:MAG: acyl-CoA mutase large subunit family protein [Bacteroidales bacterium]|nr:acyl-CoA mutase large subunit family protein [Bacteroidales bacterium]
MDRKRERLLEEFAPLSREDWEARIIQDCRDAEYAEKLIWKSPEQINVKPFYCAEDILDLEYPEALPGVFPFVRGNKLTGNAWEIRQDIRVHNITDANKKALFVIDKGVQAVGFEFREIRQPDYQDFKRLIDNINIEKITLHWTTDGDPAYLLDHCKRFAGEHHADPLMFNGSISFDPLGWLTRTGSFRNSFDMDMKQGEQLIRYASRMFPSIRVIMINGRHFTDAGASCVQELAFSLAVAAEYLSCYTDRGMKLENIAPHMQLNLSAGSNFFFEIAKFRASRILWSNLLMAFDKELAKRSSVHIQCITTKRNKTIYDSRVNLLRLTTEAMAAILGGCDSLLIEPYDICFKEPDDFSERLARNLQIILREEAHFSKIADPAGGAYYIESLTDAICSNAWNIFLETERKGGYLEALKCGSIQKEIRDNDGQTYENVASAKQVIVGTNAYPDNNEKVYGSLDPDIAFYRQPVGNQPVVDPVIPVRTSSEFENIRLATEKHPAGRPKVFMLTYGDMAMRHARSLFACNFFGSAGYEVIDNPGFEVFSEGIPAAFDAKADIIVACSSDDEYMDTIPQIFSMVQGKAILVVAGAPACMDDLRRQGIMDFIYKGINMIEALQYFHNKLGIAL